MVKRVLVACGLGAISVAASCTQVLDIRQPLRPAPSLVCLTGALETSEDVVLVRRTEYHFGYATVDFAVRDSTAKADKGHRLKAGQRLAQLGRRGDSPKPDDTPGDTVILQFAVKGGADDAQVRALTEVGVRVLRHARGRCAPGEAAAPVCTVRGQPLPC
jgi:hypothetical protein